MGLEALSVRIIVAGGGYAGLAALASLRAHLPSASLTLVDPGEHHLKLTRLHEAVARPLDELQVPFHYLTKRLGATHVRGAMGTSEGLDEAGLQAAYAAGELPITAVGDEGSAGEQQALPFDALVLTSGGRPVLDATADDLAMQPRRVFSLADLRTTNFHPLLRTRVEASRGGHGEGAFAVTVVGAGASGVQYAFELNEVLRRLGAPGAVRLMDRQAMPLPDMPSRVQRHVLDRLRAAGIEWCAQSQFIAQQGQEVCFTGVAGTDAPERRAPSSLTLLLAGVKPAPVTFSTNRFGQVQIDGRTLERVFAAGDCARYDAPGADTPSAQVALRQGKHAAINLARVYRRRQPIAYVFGELGYIVSLGMVDAAGWVLSRSQVVTGMPAVVMKTMVDAQYDLFLEGIDTYVI